MVTPRNELKFYLSSAHALLLERRLSSVLKQDFHSPDPSGYGIRSLYFDDPLSTAYFDKINGLKNRAKYRIRFYNGNLDFIRLEKKEKIGQLSRKYALSISRKTAESLLLPDFRSPVSDAPLLGEMEHLIRHDLLHPVLFVDYRRKAFLYPTGNVRITLDRELFASRFTGRLEEGGLPRLPGLESGRTILEVKYDSFFPPFLSQLLEDIPKVKCAISKFSIARELLF